MQKKTIDRRWLPLNALRAFEGVAKHGSFTAAANALLISQSALSRHVIALERLTGVQLFERRPHALTLTKAVPILRDFRRASTEVDIDLISPYGVGPPLGDVDVAVVYSKPAVTDLVTDLLWGVRLSVLCHPEIAAAHRGKTLAAFIEANEIVHVRIADLPRHHSWSQFVRTHGLPSVNIERGLVFDTAVLAAQYALGGQGIALVDCNLFADEIRDGRLVKPFEATLDDGYGYYLTTHPEGLGDTAIALFRSWLIGRFGTRGVPAAAPAVQLAVSNE
jgi:DNA-binding transcriptional LysR family regulator